MGQFSCPGRPKILVPPRLVVLEMKNLTKNCTNTLQCAMGKRQFMLYGLGKRQFMLYGLSVNQLAHQKNSGPKWPPRRLQKPHCQFSGFLFIPFPVIFSCQKLCNSIFLCEITTFTSRFLSFDTNFFQHGLDY